MTALQNFAKLTGTTEAQASSYAKCIRYWMNKGMTIEAAVARHQQFLINLVEEAKAGKLNEMVADEIYQELRTRGRQGLNS
jgi:hypothetical protein